jgi:putative transposase
MPTPSGNGRLRLAAFRCCASRSASGPTRPDAGRGRPFSSRSTRTVYQDGLPGRFTRTARGARRASAAPGALQEGTPGLRRITRKRGEWIAAIAGTLASAEPTTEQGTMGVDRGVTIPAVIHVIGKGPCYRGTGRSPRMMRRRYAARRQQGQRAGKIRAVRTSRGHERRWMRARNQTLSRQSVPHAQAPGVASIRREHLAGIRQPTHQRTAGPRRGAQARKNNRLIATEPCSQRDTFVAEKAARVGIRVEQVDPASTSQTCPACFARNTAQDRRSVGGDCGGTGHRAALGATHSNH